MAAPTFSLTVTASDTDSTTTVFSDVGGDNGRIMSFSGEEHVSRPFEYRLQLEYTYEVVAGQPPPIDFSKLVNQKAVLNMAQQALETKGVFNKEVDHKAVDDKAGDPPKMVQKATYIPTTVDIKGVLSNFRVTKKVKDGTLLCEAVLVPALWRLGMSKGSRVFQERTTQQIVQKVLEGAGFMVITDFEFKLSGTYPIREFCMQYQESDLDFIQRLLEYEGIFYYFVDGRLIFSDDKALPELEGRKGVWFYEPTGGMTPTDDQVYSFIYSEQVVPSTVTVQDHDFESFLSEDDQPLDTDVNASGETHARVGVRREHGRFVVSKRSWVAEQGADPDGKLSTQVSGPQGNVKTRESELLRIATLRAQEVEARRQTATAKSTIARIQPGHVLGLTDHFLFDDSYLVTAVSHKYEGGAYMNDFVCLASDVQYRPPRSTPIPRVPGILTAKVKGADPADDDAGPHIDDEGRYRVRFPFDPNAAAAAEPSRPVRLAQPYAGKGYGMHFPNRGEVEMVLACLDGDPDRPLGLSVVPTPWKHTPVPNSKHKLGSQNPTTGSSVNPAEGSNYTNAITDEADSHEYTFGKTKNVIRTQRGHQLVMDDDGGGANVGITLQVGSAENKTKRDIYWGSKIELGGYRHLSTMERILGIASTATGWFRTVFTRDFPGMASEALAIMASQVTTDDYADDTFGTTTPVGVNIFTNKNVNVTGKDGVNITSPNLFGMFSTSLFSGDDDSKNQYQAEAISKFIINSIWQEVIDGTASEVLAVQKKMKKYQKKDYNNPKSLAALTWSEKFKQERISTLIFTLLQRTGVNISSMGELKMTSLQSTSVAAGQGGLNLKSFGGIEQKADLGIEIAAHEGVKISSKGKPYREGGIFAAIEKKAGVHLGFQTLLKTIKAAFRKKKGKEVKPDEIKIELENEEGDIFLHTGTGDDGGGDIMVHAEGKGHVRTFANEGEVHAWSGGDGITLEVGKRITADKNDPLPKKAAKGRLLIETDKVHGFSSKEVQLVVGADFDRDDSGITIKKDSILIKCGKSSITLTDKGDITLEGKNITITGAANVDVKGKKVTTKADLGNAMKGKFVTCEGDMTCAVKGKKVDVEGQLAGVTGKLIKVG